MSDPNVPPPPYPGPPPTPPGYPPSAPPQMVQYGPAPKPKGGKGCLIALVIVMILGIGTVVAAYAGLNWLGNKAEDAIGTTGPCPYLTHAEASEIMGPDTEATLFTGLGRVLNITDARVLPGESSCFLGKQDSSSEDEGGLGRVVKYDGNDAAARFEQELTKAGGGRDAEGLPIRANDLGYVNKGVTGIGDEAFCTEASANSVLAGVLVRQGDTLVYASVAADIDASPGLDLDDPDHPKLGTDDSACEMAQQLVRKVLD